MEKVISIGGGGYDRKAQYITMKSDKKFCNQTLEDLKAERKVSTKKTVGKSSPKPPEFIDLEVSFLISNMK